MKKTLLLAAVAVGLMIGTAGVANADYRHDDRGYWDGHHHYHHYSHYNNQRGYWDERNGVRVFISL